MSTRARPVPGTRRPVPRSRAAMKRQCRAAKWRSHCLRSARSPADPCRAERGAGRADGRTNGGMWVACLAAGRRVARWDQYSYIVSGVGQAASTRWSRSSIGRRAATVCWGQIVVIAPSPGGGGGGGRMEEDALKPVLRVSAWRYYRYCSWHQCRRVKISLD